MHENITRIKAVAGILKQLEQPVVFVGGAVVSLYASNPVASASIRPTLDVDVVVELATYNGYAQLENRLREIGFVNDIESGVICRYTIHGIVVDIMPVSDKALGFGNRWYPVAFDTAIDYVLDEKTVIKLFTLPYFLAAKWEAHKARGGDDLRFSTDFEDMVYVMEHCVDFDQQLAEGPAEIREYFSAELAGLLNSIRFEEAVYCHMSTARHGANSYKIIQPLKDVLNL